MSFVSYVLGYIIGTYAYMAERIFHPLFLPQLRAYENIKEVILLNSEITNTAKCRN